MLRRRINYQAASIALFALLLLVILLTFRRYGISWDEGVHDKIGSEIWNYYLSLFRGGPVDQQVLGLGNPVAYGGVFNLITGGIQKLSPLDRFETRHLVNALFGLLGILGCWKTARLLAGDKAAFWSALLLAIIPGYYGHMFFNPKDIPFAAGYIWSLYYILASLREYPQISWPTLLKLGFTVGLAMGTRVGGVMLLGYFGLAVVAVAAICPPRLAWAKPDLLSWKFLIRRVILPVLFVGLISYALMVAFWPWAQQNPWVNPVLALTAQGQIDYQDEVLYRGVSYPGSALPPDYVAGNLLVTLPEVVLILLATGLVLAILMLLPPAKSLSRLWTRGFSRGVLDAGKPAEWRTSFAPSPGFARAEKLSRYRAGLQSPSFTFVGILLLLFSILFPILLVIVQQSVLYDGVRHFIFILPPIACLAGISYQTLSDRLEEVQKWAAWILNLAVVVAVGFQVYTMAKLHPYEYIYYNSLVGGLKGAYQSYETDYWGLSTSEAARWLEDYVESQSTGKAKAVPVYTCSGNASASHYFEENLALVPSPERAHYGILITRWNCDQRVKGEVLYTIQRYGVPLVYVKELY